VSSFEHRFSISHPANVGELPPLAHPGSRPTVCSGRGYLLFRKGRGFPGSTQCGPSRGWSICLDRGRFADALGLTTVHVNRALQHRRVDGLIETKGTQPKIPDWAGLTWGSSTRLTCIWCGRMLPLALDI
jgi:hypothetical protein